MTTSEEAGYIHGYTREEQDRLVQQAHYWRDTLILPGLAYQPGQRLLELGCGVGAVLGILGAACPGLHLAGIDLAPEQIAYARQHLGRLGHADAVLRQGDARQLPWEANSFDHLFVMWFLEHVVDPHPYLTEARGQQRPPGCGRSPGCRGDGFHHFTGAPGEGLGAFVAYLLGFLEPMVPRLSGELGLDPGRLRAGAAFMRSLPTRAEASLTQVVFRGSAVR